MNIYYVAAIWLGMALIASVVSITEEEEALGEEDVSIIHRTGGAGTTVRSE